MGEIRLSESAVALVDDADVERMEKCDWHELKLTHTSYAVRRGTDSDGAVLIYMHRELTAAPAGLEVDHENRNGLDNRRHNLRVATRRQNMMNKGPKPGATSRFKGVSWNATRQKWRARIHAGPIGSAGQATEITIGRFDDEVDAACAYDAAARRFFGKFAHLNFPDRNGPTWDAVCSAKKMQIGEHHHNAKLLEGDVISARIMRDLGYKMTDIAVVLGVKYITLRDACVGVTWQHIPTDANVLMALRH